MTTFHLEPDFMHTHFRQHTETVAKSLESLGEPIMKSATVLVEALRSGKKAIAFGNGGSAAQASHFAGELIGRFRLNRRPIPAVALGADSGVVTCIANDFGYAALYERQVQALANPGDVAIGFTTSGRSENVLRGLTAAHEKGATTIMMCGEASNLQLPDAHILGVSSSSTACIQEVHLMIIHIWCHFIDEAFTGTE
jgi:D-sedoheptulose 7-phosphate isomerase